MKKHEMKKHDARVKRTKLAALALAMLMFCPLLSGCAGSEVSALSGEGTPGCQHVHDESCGYAAADPGSPCTHEHTEACYTLTCSQEEHEHTEACYTLNCQHVHDDSCGYRAPMEEQPCTHTHTDECYAQAEESEASAEPAQSVESDTSAEPAQSEEPGTSAEPTQSEEPGVTAEPSQTPQSTATTEAGGSIITDFTNEPITVEVARGAAIADIPLPATLPAINENGEGIEVPVIWTNNTGDINGCISEPDDYETGSTYGYGPWTFTATVDAAYAYAGEPVTASVSIPDCKEIQSFCGNTTGGLLVRTVIFEGEAVNLPTEVGAFMTDGGYKNIPVSWSGSYDTETAGMYELAMNIDGGYTGGGAAAEIVVMQAAGEQQREEQ